MSSRDKINVENLQNRHNINKNMQYTEVHFKQHEYNVSAQRLMMMMMMMDELTLTWHIVLRLQGHVTVKKESRIVDALVDCTSRDSCMSERKARSSVYHEKLAVMTKPERTLADCSKQMRQLPGRHGRRW